MTPAGLMVPRSTFLLLAALGLCVARRADAQGAGRLTDEGEVSRVVPLFEAGRYPECAAQFGVLLDPAADRPLTEARWIEAARLFRVACLLGMGQTEEAEGVLRQALRDNPRMAPPDALVFPPAVVDAWARVRDTLRDELRRADEERLERARAEQAARAARVEERRRKISELQLLATRREVVRENRRWVAAVPFGVGQFQNGQSGLGYTFLVSEALLGITAIGALLVNASTYRQIATGKNLEPEATNRQLRTSYDVFVWSSWGFLGVTALGIAHAQLTFVPRVIEVRRVPLPEHLKRVELEVSAAAPRGPLGLWLGGRF